MEFYVGAADVESGRIVYHNCKDGGRTDVEWMRASASMPLVSRIVEIGRYKLLDGGIVDPVPYRFMEREGYGRNVYVLTQPKGYRKEKAAALPLMRLVLRRTPRMAEAMAVRHEVYNRQMEEIDEKERRGEILVLRPPESLGIRRTERDPNELERVYQIGRRVAHDALSRVREYLAAGERGKS